MANAAATAGAAVGVGTDTEKTLFGLSTEVSISFSAVEDEDDVADEETNFETGSVAGGAATMLRTPIFEATIVGAMPFDAAGEVVGVTAAEGDEAGAETGTAE